MSRRSFCDDDVSRVSNDGHAIRVQQLTVALAALAELKLEAALLVENLKKPTKTTMITCKMKQKS